MKSKHFFNQLYHMTKPKTETAGAELAPAVSQTETEAVSMEVNDAQGRQIDFLLKAQEVANALNLFTEAVKLNVEYLELKAEGEQVRGVFMGYGKATMKNPQTGEFKEMKTVILYTPDGVKISAGINLLNTFEGANLPTGAPVSVTYTGAQKIDGGKAVKVYEVYLLKSK
jgi:hypothetical protein